MSSVAETKKPYSDKDKWIVAIIAGLLFLLLASPFMYSLVNQVTKAVGMATADAKGCANGAGLLLHALIFLLIVRLLMR